MLYRYFRSIPLTFVEFTDTVTSFILAEQPVTEKDIVVADKEKQSPLYLVSFSNLFTLHTLPKQTLV